MPKSHARRSAVTVVCIVVSMMLVLPHAPADAQCCGDCDGSGSVTVDDLIAAVNVALSHCPVQPTATATATQPVPSATVPAAPTCPGIILTEGPTPSPTPTVISPRFVDNGDGTVTDTQSGLQWEKKDHLDYFTNANNPHDGDNDYTWSDTGPAYEVPSGTVYTDFLNKLNNCTYDGSTYGGGFAEHCDWRLPTDQELLSIVDLTALGCYLDFIIPCIPSVFGPTQADSYWSSITNAGFPNSAWVVPFHGGSPGNGYKGTVFFVRAVRGAS